MLGSVQLQLLVDLCTTALAAGDGADGSGCSVAAEAVAAVRAAAVSARSLCCCLLRRKRRLLLLPLQVWHAGAGAGAADAPLPSFLATFPPGATESVFEDTCKCILKACLRGVRAAAIERGCGLFGALLGGLQWAQICTP